jgi:hypothetical protein
MAFKISVVEVLGISLPVFKDNGNFTNGLSLSLAAIKHLDYGGDAGCAVS